MYIQDANSRHIPPNRTRKFYIIWKLRSNNEATWLAKEDCPTKVHCDEHLALLEANRLTEKHQETFIVLEATHAVKPIKRPTSETIPLV